MGNEGDVLKFAADVEPGLVSSVEAKITRIQTISFKTLETLYGKSERLDSIQPTWTTWMI